MSGWSSSPAQGHIAKASNRTSRALSIQRAHASLPNSARARRPSATVPGAATVKKMQASQASQAARAFARTRFRNPTAQRSGLLRSYSNTQRRCQRAPSDASPSPIRSRTPSLQLKALRSSKPAIRGSDCQKGRVRNRCHHARLSVCKQDRTRDHLSDCRTLATRAVSYLAVHVQHAPAIFIDGDHGVVPQVVLRKAQTRTNKSLPAYTQGL